MKETGAIRLTNKDKPNPILLFFLFFFFFVNEMYSTYNLQQKVVY